MNYLIVLFALCGFFSAYVAGRKGRNPLAWWFVGALLPVIGPILSLAVPPKSLADRESARGPGGPARRRPPPRPKRCCGEYMPDCRGCPYFRRQLFDPSRAERTKGRCEFFGKDLEEAPEGADSHMASGDL